MAFGHVANAADPQSYRVDIASTGDGDRDATLKSTSDLQTLRTSAPVSPFGLIARGRGDIDRFTTVLESYGYYQSGVAVKINGMPLKDSALRDALAAAPKGTDARVEVSFTLGPLYHLRKIDVDGELPDSARGMPSASESRVMLRSLRHRCWPAGRPPAGVRCRNRAMPSRRWTPQSLSRRRMSRRSI